MLLSALVLGLMGSLHCIGMCGPIAFVLPVDRSSSTKKVFQIFTYHFGRLLAYGIIGMLFGIIGKGLYLFGMQQKLSIIVGAAMILIVVLPYKFLGNFSISKPLYRIIGRVKSSLGQALKRKTADTFLTIGFLNGFLPCGLVYMAVLGAIAAGNPINGAFYMVVFGIGTLPLMTIAVYFGSFLKGGVKARVRKLVPIFVALVGLLFILRGMGLGIPYVSPKPMMNMVQTEMECHNP